MLLKCGDANEIWLLVFSIFFTIVGFKLLKECFLTFSTSRFVSVLSHESIMITFYNKLPVLNVIPQNCIAHICTSLLRTTFASLASAYERVHTQHAKRRPFRKGLLSKYKKSLFSQKRAFSLMQ